MKHIKTGLGVSQGQAIGKVKIVEGPNDFNKINEGDILVAKMTDPTMTIIMGKANAIVTDTGGMACHAAIVARELGIPCVVATNDATKTLREDDIVHVCGTSGKIHLVENR